MRVKFAHSAQSLFHHQHRITQHIHSRLHAQAGRGAGGEATPFALRCTFGDARGDVAVEVRGAKEQLRRRAMRQCGYGGGNNVASPAILCLLYTSPSPRDVEESRMPSSA